MRARGAAQSASALGTIKVVNSAQLSFAITCGLGFYSPDFQTLGVKPPSSVEAFLPPELSTRPDVHQERLSVQHGGDGAARRAGIVQRPPAVPPRRRIRDRGRPARRDAGQAAYLRHRTPTATFYEHTASLEPPCPRRARRARAIRSSELKGSRRAEARNWFCRAACRFLVPVREALPRAIDAHLISLWPS